MILDDWAAQWGVHGQALADLRVRLLGLFPPEPPALPGASEAAVLSRVRLQASRLGRRLWRNNVGAGYADDGTFMRWGLANDSAQVNAVMKSADLIGITPRLIQPGDVGKMIGQFTSIECKHGDWRYTGNDREVAQSNWANLVLSLGGDARFVTSEAGL
jgi:hypothetical protein